MYYKNDLNERYINTLIFTFYLFFIKTAEQRTLYSNKVTETVLVTYLLSAHCGAMYQHARLADNE